MPFPRPHVAEPIEYGNASSFWVEYPSGLIDLTRETHIAPKNNDETVTTNGTRTIEPPLHYSTQLEIPVDGNRVVRLAKARSAVVIVDMQKYAHRSIPSLLIETNPAHALSFFLHPDLRDHPTGLQCVIPVMNVVTALRTQGIKILWV